MEAATDESLDTLFFFSCHSDGDDILKNNIILHYLKIAETVVFAAFHLFNFQLLKSHFIKEDVKETVESLLVYFIG